MKILYFVTDAFGGRGGISQYNRDFINSLCSADNCDEVVGIPRKKLVDRIEALPQKLTYITSGLKGKFAYIRTVFRIIRANPKFDLIVCGHLYMLPLAWLVKLWIKAPILLEIYGIEAWKPHNSLVNYCLSRVDCVVSISQITLDRFQSWANIPKVQQFLLPNAIVLEQYGHDEKNAQLISQYELKDKIVLMTLGRLDSYERCKGFDEVIEVLPKLSEIIPNLVYLIVGEGSDRERLEQKVRSLNLQEKVIFTGFISEAEKADHYRLADVYAMPSKGEGFGFVFLEAMACGIPVVASKVDGSREAVRNGLLGILVNPDDLEEVKAGILEALKRPKGVIPRGLDYFSYENFERRCHQICDQILQVSSE
ncbi:glycosyltransferase family 4 protein [Nostoc sp. FACHB-888]|uniref:glycosyltransferase family 4 protein n=1 Tax=Nostoc sp. FACHB-888 TaxID=2692842 RepID=UPI0016897DD5|nr:glycosyltransferase family 4 protein [Nostoc sp. FACHB-888]MBD2245409.1 glycosyltransferase family 4 protein [Nostoc sp. FACHB-888]